MNHSPLFSGSVLVSGVWVAPQPPFYQGLTFSRADLKPSTHPHCRIIHLLLTHLSKVGIWKRMERVKRVEIEGVDS